MTQGHIRRALHDTNVQYLRYPIEWSLRREWRRWYEFKSWRNYPSDSSSAEREKKLQRYMYMVVNWILFFCNYFERNDLKNELFYVEIWVRKMTDYHQIITEQQCRPQKWTVLRRNQPGAGQVSYFFKVVCTTCCTPLKNEHHFFSETA